LSPPDLFSEPRCSDCFSFARISAKVAIIVLLLIAFLFAFLLFLPVLLYDVHKIKKCIHVIVRTFIYKSKQNLALNVSFLLD